MSIESKFDGKTVTTGLTDGSFSFEMKISEEGKRNLNLVIQHGWMYAIMSAAEDICKACLFDKHCNDCPFRTVWSNVNRMKIKIAAEMEKNREDEEEKK